MDLSKAIHSNEFNGHLKIVGYEFPAAECLNPPLFLRLVKIPGCRISRHHKLGHLHKEHGSAMIHRAAKASATRGEDSKR